jgi:hypothetical protein
MGPGGRERDTKPGPVTGRMPRPHHKMRFVVNPSGGMGGFFPVARPFGEPPSKMFCGGR